MRTILFSALALLAFMPRPVQGQQRDVAENWELEIDNVAAGHARKVEGGDMRCIAIAEPPGPDRISKKHPGKPRCAPLVVELAMPPAKPVVDWMTAMLEGRTPRKTVQLTRYTSSNSGTTLIATNCLLTKIAFPGVDAASRTTAPLILTFEPEQSETRQGNVRPSGSPLGTHAWTQNNFKFALSGSDDRYVMKVDPFTVVLKTTINEEHRIATSEPTTLEIPNLTISVDEAHSDPWKDWYRTLVPRGENEENAEKSGSLDFLVSATQTTSILKVSFSNLGLLSLQRGKVDSDGRTTVTPAKVEVYCERIAVSLPTTTATGEQGAAPAPDPAAPPAPPAPAPAPSPPAPAANPGTPAPPPPAPATNPAAPAPVPATATAEAVADPADQGARDPYDFPRPKETVRKSYASNRNKIISTEMATYSAKPKVSVLEAIFDDLLKKGGWDPNSRNETGDAKKNTHTIALILKKGPRTANLTLGQTKDGTTEYTVVLNEPADAPRPIRPVDLNPTPAAGGVNKDELRDRAIRPLPPTPAPNTTPATAPVPATAPSTAKMTTFDPKLYGFKFTNDFRNSVFGPPIKVVTAGLCGGMSYASLDYYLAGVEAPKQDYRPSHNTPFQTYLYRRQETSLLFNLDNWANYELDPFGSRSLEIFNWGLRERLAELRASIDKGMPIPLGLKGTVAAFGHDHQVLAIGYDMGRYKGDVGDNITDLKIFLCEPNYPGEIITMVPDPAKREFTYKGYESSVRWRSYFTDVKYTKMAPPAVRNPLDPQANRDGLMHALRCRFVTGAEELRGGTLFVNLSIQFHDGTRQEYQNISEGGRWLPEYSETVEVMLTKPRKFEEIRFIEINTSNKVGPRGDRWDMKECSITVLGGGFALGMPFKDPGAYKFQGLPLQVVPK